MGSHIWLCLAETCNRIEGRRDEWERLEAESFRSQQVLEHEVRAILDAGHHEEARSQLDAWVRSRVVEHLAAV